MVELLSLNSLIIVTNIYFSLNLQKIFLADRQQYDGFFFVWIMSSYYLITSTVSSHFLTLSAFSLRSNVPIFLLELTCLLIFILLRRCFFVFSWQYYRHLIFNQNKNIFNQNNSDQMVIVYMIVKLKRFWNVNQIQVKSLYSY